VVVDGANVVQARGIVNNLDELESLFGVEVFADRNMLQASHKDADAIAMHG
jgi:hypothetical protein